MRTITLLTLIMMLSACGPNNGVPHTYIDGYDCRDFDMAVAYDCVEANGSTKCLQIYTTNNKLYENYSISLEDLDGALALCKKGEYYE